MTAKKIGEINETYEDYYFMKLCLSFKMFLPKATIIERGSVLAISFLSLTGLPQGWAYNQFYGRPHGHLDMI